MATINRLPNALLWFSAGNYLARPEREWLGIMSTWQWSYLTIAILILFACTRAASEFTKQ